MASALTILLLACVAGSALSANLSVSVGPNGQTYAPGDIIFEDNFDFLNMEVWQHEITMSGGGNWEFQVYHNSRTNSYVRNGVLHISPTLTNERHGDNFVETGTLSLLGGSPADECTNPAFWGCERAGGGGNVINPTMSARLRTVDSFSFKYGKVDVRAKLPAGDWLWPAIWMLPRYNAYGIWPASGEIDIMESRGNRKLFNPVGQNIGSEQTSFTLHYGPYWPYNGYENAHFERNTPFDQGFDRDFHNYGIEWTPEHIKFLLDNVEVGTVAPPAGGFWELGGFPNDIDNPWEFGENPRMAPFDQKFYFIINLAVGGTNGFFPDDVINNPPKPWSNEGGNAFAEFWAGRSGWYPTWQGTDKNLQIDYIRVTAL